MQVEFGDVRQIVDIVKMGVDVCRELNSDGTLKVIGGGMAGLFHGIEMEMARIDVDKYKYYTENGILPEHAILLICTHNAAYFNSVKNAMSDSKKRK